jgi:nucleoid-associated protein YgaU
MGFFDFIKEAGDRDGIDRTGATETDKKELQTQNTVIRKIQGKRLSIEGLKADFDDGTVVLTGKALDQATREMAVLLAGNTTGVARVDDRMTAGATGAGATPSAMYTVKKGDTLSAIAQRELGAASRWKDLLAANQPMITDADKIYPGQVLRIPKP